MCSHLLATQISALKLPRPFTAYPRYEGFMDFHIFQPPSYFNEEAMGHYHYLFFFFFTTCRDFLIFNQILSLLFPRIFQRTKTLWFYVFALGDFCSDVLFLTIVIRNYPETKILFAKLNGMIQIGNPRVEMLPRGHYSPSLYPCISVKKKYHKNMTL